MEPVPWFFLRIDDLSFSASFVFLMRLSVSELNLLLFGVRVTLVVEASNAALIDAVVSVIILLGEFSLPWDLLVMKASFSLESKVDL